MKTIGKILVGVLDSLHVGIVVIIVLGWALEGLFYVYGFFLISTALSWVIFGRCILVDFEFWLRDVFSIRKGVQEKTFTATFLNNLLGRKIVSEKLIYYVGLVVLSISIPIWLLSFV